MAIEYYFGTVGPTINVESIEELHEAVDILHTQALELLGENNPALRILEEAMDKLHRIISDAEDFVPNTWGNTGDHDETNNGHQRAVASE